MIKNTIVLVPFPFDNLLVSKVRPALCLTSEIGKFNHIIIAFITSKTPDDLLDSDVILKKETENFLKTGLIVDSVIRLHKIVTVPKSLIKRKLGVITKPVEMEIKRKIKHLFET